MTTSSQPSPHRLVLGGPIAPRLDDVIERASEQLLRAQRPDGGWDATCSMGPALVAALVVTEHYLGVLTPPDVSGCRRALRASQQGDGGFLGHPYGLASDPSTTRLCVAALRILEAPDTLRRAEAYLATVPHEAMGRGDEIQFTFLSLFLVISGEVPKRSLPNIPLDVALVPGLDWLVDRRIHAGNILALFSLAAAVDDRRGGAVGLWGAAKRAMARDRIVRYLETQQNPNGSWNSAVIQTLTLIVGYAAAGVRPDDSRIVRALAFVERHKVRTDDGLRMRAFTAEVWCTGYAMLALEACGDHDEAVQRGSEFLMACQSRTPQPRYTQPKRGVPRIGGWPFETGNALMPDCDDTGVALDALGTIRGRSPSRLADSAIQEGLAWIEAMQNPTGGWAAYVWGMADKPPGPAFVEPPVFVVDDPRTWIGVLRDPPPELADVAWEDVTARVLDGLGSCGLRAGHPMVDKATAFLEMQQCDNGAWWGRWILGYLPATSHALMALASVGVAPPMASRAIAWLRSCQNDDGGWGEAVDVYRHPERAGRGPSNPCATGLVVSALVAQGRADDEATTRGVAYLLQTQDADGGWPNLDFLHVLVPPDSHYELGISRQVYPLRALAQYRRAVGSC